MKSRNKIAKTLVLTLVVLFAMPAMAQKFTYNYRGIEFKCKVKDKTAIITDFTNDAAKVVIPAVVKDPKTGHEYDVSTIDLYSELVSYKTNSVAIEKGITVIADYCFTMFKNLEQIYIPSTIEKIGKKAFNSKKFPTCTMPSSISEDDLRKGLAIYPKVVEADPMADLNLADYSDFNSQTSTPAANNIFAQEEAKPAGITPGTSDIDFNIPTTNMKRENTFCLIIANEDYAKHDTPKVKYAAQDGKTFYNYCTKTLGMPRENIKMTTNATYLQMKDQINWLTKVAGIYGDEANFLVYYAGHGVPDEQGNCKLMPVDVSINDVDNGYSLKELYDQLSNVTTKSALLIVDACFSGNDRSNTTALDEVHRGFARDIREEKVGGNVVVMTAASNTETALSYDEKGHGLFSYYVMKKLQDTKGNVTYGELFDYVNKEVMRKSTVVLNKTQTPSINVSNMIENTWRNIKF